MENTSMKFTDKNDYKITFPSGEEYHLTIEDTATVLGKEMNGIVYKVTSSTGQIYSINKISKQQPIAKEQIISEVYLLNSIEVNEKYGSAKPKYDFTEDKTSYYILMPYFDKVNLENLIVNDLITSETQALEYFKQMCYLIRQLHTRHFIHTNLTTNNFKAMTFNAKSEEFKHMLFISDMCFCENLKCSQSVYKGANCGIAPEIESDLFDQRADVYSLGCILFKMLTKADPFPFILPDDIAKAKKQNYINVKSVIPKPLSKFTMSLLEGCLQYDKSNRLSMKEIDALLDLSGNENKLDLAEPDISFKINLLTHDRKINSKMHDQHDERKALSFISNQSIFIQNRTLASNLPCSNIIDIPSKILPPSNFIPKNNIVNSKFQISVPIISTSNRFAPLYDLLEFISTHKLSKGALESTSYFGFNMSYLNENDVINTMPFYKNPHSYKCVPFPSPSSENDIKKMFGYMLYVCLTGSEEILFDYNGNKIVANIGVKFSQCMEIVKLAKFLKECFVDDKKITLHNYAKDLFFLLKTVKGIENKDVDGSLRIELPINIS